MQRKIEKTKGTKFPEDKDYIWIVMVLYKQVEKWEN